MVKICFVLFILIINPHPERNTISQQKHNLKKDKTTVWIKWPTQGRATYV